MMAERRKMLPAPDHVMLPVVVVVVVVRTGFEKFAVVDCLVDHNLDHNHLQNQQ